jgi:hypothetical protein
MLPPNAPAVMCCCGMALRHTDFDHAMRCSALAPQLMLRHDILRGILRRAVHWVGIANKPKKQAELMESLQLKHPFLAQA